MAGPGETAAAAFKNGFKSGLTFDTLVEGTATAGAAAACTWHGMRATCTTRGSSTAAGIGQTHLMHAVGNAAADGRFQSFSNHAEQSCRCGKRTNARLSTRSRSAITRSLLLIDAQFFANRTAPRTILHAFRALLPESQIVMTSDTYRRSWPTSRAVVSRFDRPDVAIADGARNGVAILINKARTSRPRCQRVAFSREDVPLERGELRRAAQDPRYSRFNQK